MEHSCRLSLTFLFIFISLHFCSNAASIVPDTCKIISRDDSDVDYNFCQRAFRSDKRSSGATTLEQLGAISFQLGIAKASTTSSMVKKLLNNPKYNLNAKNTLNTLLELYSDARVDLEAGLQALQFNDFLEANNRASSATVTADTCREAGKAKKRAPLVKEIDDFFQLTSISNALTDMLQEMRN